MDSLLRHYKEIVNRIKSKTPDFDEYKFHILVVDENNFDGMPVQSCTISKDRKWICIPRECEDQLGVGYIPICYEVVEEFETFLGNGSISWRCRVFILNRRY